VTRHPPGPPACPGRLPQNWDGSGGNGAALRHFEATGRRYPLAVKLGTITPHGADVYSYAGDEDDMVTDPALREHLAHWGINMMAVRGPGG
jgi:ubiquitin carboxyl-terminal hydrolase 5/13